MGQGIVHPELQPPMDDLRLAEMDERRMDLKALTAFNSRFGG
jgi:hypothetical protein